MTRPPLPPFSAESAAQKVRLAENAWNSRDADIVTPAYTDDSQMAKPVRVPDRPLPKSTAFLTRKWQTEHEYRLIKELWAQSGNRIAVRYVYEWHNDAGQWMRSHGNENWAFAPDGRMSARHASINDVPITADQRLFHWPLRPTA